MKKLNPTLLLALSVIFLSACSDPQPTPVPQTPVPTALITSEPTLKWKSKNNGIHPSKPLAHNGVVYVASSVGLTAIDATTGNRLWTFDADGVTASPPIVVGDTIYFSAHGLDETSITPDHATIYAVSLSSHNLAWKLDIEEEATTILQEQGGTLYFAGVYTPPSVSPRQGALYAINSATGEVKWRSVTSRSVLETPAISNDLLYYGDGLNQLYAVNLTTGLEEDRIEVPMSGVTSPVVHNGIFYFLTADGLKYTSLQAIDSKTHKRLWFFRQEDRSLFYPVLSEENNTIYITTEEQRQCVNQTRYDDRFMAFDATTGEEKWRLPLSGFGMPPVIQDGKAFMVLNAYSDDCLMTTDSSILALNLTTQAEEWRFAIPEAFYSGHTVADGVVYVTMSLNMLYAIEDR